MIALDTNVLIRYWTEDDEDQAERAAILLESLTPEAPGFIAVIVWVEAYWVLSRTYHVAKPKILHQFSELLETDGIIAENYSCVASAIRAAEKGADFSDALIDASAHLAKCVETKTFHENAVKHLGWKLV